MQIEVASVDSAKHRAASAEEARAIAKWKLEVDNVKGLEAAILQAQEQKERCEVLCGHFAKALPAADFFENGGTYYIVK